ncbi:MAG: hypothetical protein N2594_01585 [Clostridiales bacterium]|nr:hypothetical protein [Clostridiales bacterium]
MEDNVVTLNQVQDIINNLKLFSDLTVLNTCLLSGCGSITNRNKEILEKIYNHSEDKIDDIFDNIVPIRCVYKKAKPVFAPPQDDYLNYGIYMWDINSFNKIITVEGQCYAILSMLSLANNLKETRPYLSNTLVNVATQFYDFLCSHMRNEEGLFIDVKDKSKSYEDKPDIKPNKTNIKIQNQLLVFTSLLYLKQIYNNVFNQRYANENETERFNFELSSIYEYITSIKDELIFLSSRGIAQCINLLYSCTEIDDDESRKLFYKECITLLCDELTNRIKATGEVEKGENNFSPVSFYTNIRCSNALMEGYLATGIDKFLDFSTKIYKYVLAYYNPNYSLFIQNYENKVSMSIRDIAETVKLLLLRYKIFSDEASLNTLVDFYNSAVNNSGIVQNINLATKDLESYFQNLNINDKPPIFLKSIRINFKKENTIKASKYFNTTYALYGAYVFLNTNL